MADIYLELTIILFSVIAVLSVLIVYIIKQTLALKREYHIQVHKKNADKELWIDRQESSSHILVIPDQHEERNDESNETSNLEQMVTFTKRSSESVNHVGNGEEHQQQQQHHNHNHNHNHKHMHHVHSSLNGGPSLVSESELYYQQSTDVNEYSEYCVPNCEPIEHH